MRVTTNSMVRNYNSSLSSTLNTLNASRTKLETRRKFTKAYEDPAAASKTASLTKKYLETEDHIASLKDAISRQDSADSVIQQVVTMTGNAANDEGLKAVNGSTSVEARQAYATSLRQTQQSMLQLANAQYSNSYLFAGADGNTAPFALDADGEVTFRGIKVSSATQADIGKLDDLVNEKVYIDVGLGFQLNPGVKEATSYKDVNGATAYDMALSGLSLFGYGSVTNTSPEISKNAIELLGQMADALESPAFDTKHYNKLTEQLRDCHSNMADFNAEVGVKRKFLETTQAQLETNKNNIYTQIDTLANIEPAEAIMDYSYSQYAYNMVLKVGNSLLSNSFIDFMK